MKRKKEIVAENLTRLRKLNHLTQIDLSEKINYSDKTISRWENGEVEPDFDTLETLGKIYGVSFEYFFEAHEENEEIAKHKRKINNSTWIIILADLFVWTLLTLIFIYKNVFLNISDWPIFVLGLSLSSILFGLANKLLFRNKICYFTFNSLIVWSSITYVYLIYLPLNLWALFFLGLPIQAIVVVLYFIIYEK